jgi:hypothetical protein
VAPDGNTKAFAFDKMGARVPTILISPWVDAGVYPETLEHTSLLKYVTDKWELGALGARVPQSNSFVNALTIRTAARLDCPKSVTAPTVAPNDLPVALNAHQVALAGFTHDLEVNRTQAGDSVVAAHSRAMGGDFLARSKAVVERIGQFFAKPAPASVGASSS